MSHKKHAYIICTCKGTQCQEGIADLCEVLHGTGFEIEKNPNPPDNDEEYSNPKQSIKETRDLKYKDYILHIFDPKDLDDFLKDNVAKKINPSCIFLYLIAQQTGYDFKNADGKNLNLFNIWKTFEHLDCPKLIFIQANVGEDAKNKTVLLNSDGDRKKFTYPGSSDILMAYLPNRSKAATPVAKILAEELRKPCDINTTMTAVISRIKSMSPKTCPKFSSTLLKPLQLCPSNPDILSDIKLEEYPCRKMLVYAFLFSKFDNRHEPFWEETMYVDRRNLEDTFKEPKFQLKFCGNSAEMKTEDFKGELKKILQGDEEKKKLETCDALMLIISSHGDENGIVYTYDGTTSVDYVLQELCNCKELTGKPKVLLIDACRGSIMERARGQRQESVPPHEPPKKPNSTCENFDMTDVLVVLSSVEGTMSHVSSQGSLLTYTLCQNLKACREKNILTMMNTVMEEVALGNKWVEDDIRPVKQQVTFTSTLMKQLHLP